jgi:hypothetical protein
MCRSLPSHLALYIVLIVALVGCSTTAPPPRYYVEPYNPTRHDAIPAEPARYAGIPVAPARFDRTPVAARPQAQHYYTLLDSAAVQKLPNRQGGIFGLKDAMPIPVKLSDGTTVVVYRVDKIDHRAPPPFRIGDVLCTVNGAFFSTIDGMPRYVQSLAPDSTATVEYLPREWVTPKRRASSRYASPAHAPAASETVQIISTPTRYFGQPVPERTEAGLRNELAMSAAGYGLGTIIQGVINAFGGLPSPGTPVIMPPRGRPGGWQEFTNKTNEGQSKPENNGPSIYEVPPIHPNYGPDHTPK